MVLVVLQMVVVVLQMVLVVQQMVLVVLKIVLVFQMVLGGSAYCSSCSADGSIVVMTIE